MNEFDKKIKEAIDFREWVKLNFIQVNDIYYKYRYSFEDHFLTLDAIESKWKEEKK